MCCTYSLYFILQYFVWFYYKPYFILNWFCQLGMETETNGGLGLEKNDLEKSFSIVGRQQYPLNPVINKYNKTTILF